MRTTESITESSNTKLTMAPGTALIILDVTVRETPSGSCTTNLNSAKLPRHISKEVLVIVRAVPCIEFESTAGGSLLQFVRTTICTSRVVEAIIIPFLISSICTETITT